ncbi:MAG TPA: succinate dehydrogenase, hydrophobic membrane anchor protein [Rhizomicrobium sp.]|jgi:succinate dehydrogenase / fumarate reductase membrane anchor subunit|nr:succinate dehydrogenase, hydrophobic membrane anchor protein [Rhizomicrobium sp.]
MTHLDTPLHKVQGLGSAHSGVKHFWRQRVTAVALIPLVIWFAYAVLRLVGGSMIDTLSFFQHPLNAGLMTAFMIIVLYHMTLGLQMVIEDYVPSPGGKIALLLLSRAFALAVGATCVLALLRIVI